MLVRYGEGPRNVNLECSLQAEHQVDEVQGLPTYLQEHSLGCQVERVYVQKVCDACANRVPDLVTSDQNEFIRATIDLVRRHHINR